MNVSMDGLRKNLSRDYIDLLDAFDEKPSEGVCKALDQVRSMIGSLNCVYDPTCDDDLNEIDIELPWTEDKWQDESEGAE